MSIVASRLAEENDKLRKLARELAKELKWLADRFDAPGTPRQRARARAAVSDIEALLARAKAELAE